jgi:hypothetical protein
MSEPLKINIESPAEEYIIEQVSPTTQELFLLVNQLSDELLRRRQAHEL